MAPKAHVLCSNTQSPAGAHVLEAMAPLGAGDFEGSGMLGTGL